QLFCASLWNQDNRLLLFPSAFEDSGFYFLKQACAQYPSLLHQFRLKIPGFSKPNETPRTTEQLILKSAERECQGQLFCVSHRGVFHKADSNSIDPLFSILNPHYSD